MNRESLPTLRPLLKATQRFKAGTMTEADRQLIALLLSRIARDEDVRDYFFQTIQHRRKTFNPAMECAAMIHAIAERRGEKIRNKHIQRQTGLSKGQVDRAIETGGEYYVRARADLDACGLEMAELMLSDQLEELHEK